MDAILDTSFFVGPLGHIAAPPAHSAISTVTLAELQLGVLLADGADQRAARLATLAEVERAFEAIPVDRRVASAYAELVAAARRAGRRPRPMDGLIAATAMVHRVPVYTKDLGYVGLPGVEVVLVSG